MMSSMILNNLQIYYVYGHYTNNELFYIGRGKGKRAWDKYSRNSYWKNIVNKYGYHVYILYRGLTLEEANKTEHELIVDLNPKANFTLGGDGGNTLLKKSLEEKILIFKKKADSMKGKNVGNKNGMFGRSHEVKEETRVKISNSLKGHIVTDETRQKIKCSKRNISKSVFCFETKQVFISVREACNYFKINSSNLCRVLKGTRNSLKNLHFSYC